MTVESIFPKAREPGATTHREQPRERKVSRVARK